jgi:hypothetical protein
MSSLLDEAMTRMLEDGEAGKDDLKQLVDIAVSWFHVHRCGLPDCIIRLRNRLRKSSRTFCSFYSVNCMYCAQGDMSTPPGRWSE